MIIKTMKEVLKTNWPIITIFIVTLVTIRIFYLRTHREKLHIYQEFFGGASIIYIFLLFQLLTTVELNKGSGYNLIPFTEIFRYTFGSNLFIYNVVGNILIFIPFGLIVAEYIKPKTIFPPFFISLIVSSTVEYIQFNIGRSFDVDDIILNVFGCIIGYLLYVGLTAIKKHLPKLFQGDRLYNVICVILVVLFIIYILKEVGVLVF